MVVGKQKGKRRESAKNSRRNKSRLPPSNIPICNPSDPFGSKLLANLFSANQDPIIAVISEGCLQERGECLLAAAWLFRLTAAANTFSILLPFVSLSLFLRDLIERVRYPNPIPIPPFPPKLTQLDNPSTLYAHPDFSQRLANAHPIPTVVDAEAGMPLNLLAFEGIWNNAGKRDGLADDCELPLPITHFNLIFLLTSSLPLIQPSLLNPHQS